MSLTVIVVPTPDVSPVPGGMVTSLDARILVELPILIVAWTRTVVGLLTFAGGVIEEITAVG